MADAMNSGAFDRGDTSPVDAPTDTADDAPPRGGTSPADAPPDASDDATPRSDTPPVTTRARAAAAIPRIPSIYRDLPPNTYTTLTPDVPVLQVDDWRQRAEAIERREIKPPADPLLGPPPVLRGEDAEEYEALRAQVTAEWQPDGLIEALPLHRAIVAEWRRRRYERLFDALIDHLARDGIAAVVRGVLSPRAARVLLDAWDDDDPSAVQQVESLLAQYDPDGSCVRAHTIVQHGPRFDALTRLIREHERAYTRATAEIERRRIAAETGIRKGTRRISPTNFLFPPRKHMRIPDDPDDAVL
ncbi:hypothetical protein NK718_21195 [Alsobacter sp. SYSU M60028]|uniref:Uncharacterized protein n=1 Tax=Alsobacter ponti TaxID=2962936 RepID=A0ABT1LJB1_9HYPH|nr:hypothetical protein [Alsobacter ponti]MCP8941046.1 hypothetical protein [Alsobacter ponti]